MPESSKDSKKDFKKTLAAEPDTVRRMALINFAMDMIQDPEEAILSYNLPDGYYEQWAQQHFDKLVNAVAKQTGADPEQIADKDKRTPEQQNALYLISGREQVARLQAVLKSNYHAAIGAVNDYCAAQAETDIYEPLRNEYMPDALQKGELVNAPLAAILYYFATHTDIDPRAQDGLTDANKADIIAIFKRIDAFYMAHRDTIHSEQDLAKAFVEAESPPNPAKVQETLERLTTLAIVPKSYVTPNHKLVNTLTRATRTPEDVIEIVLDVSKRGAKNKVTATCILSYEGDNVKISGRQPFTEFDRNVYNAVVSLYVAGNTVITSAMVWRTMTGKTDAEKPTQGQAAAVTKSLDKMRFMRAQIDCSDEFKMQRVEIDGKNITGAGYDDNLLHLSVKWVKAAKTTIRAYEILSAPVLYQYSAAVKQVITVPLALLDIKKLDKQGSITTHSAEYTERRSIITNYLIRRIEGMKGKNNLDNRCIAFTDYEKSGKQHEGLYSVAGCPELSQQMPEGLTDAEKQKRKDDARYIRADAKLALDNWKATGYIKGYKEYKKGTTVAGFEIDI